MIRQSIKYRVLVVLSLLGLAIALLAGVSEHVAWLQSFCNGLSGACKETTAFTLLKQPLWVWGAVFYLLLALSAFKAPRWLLWLAACAVGTEVTLVWIMISTKTMCVYCLGNVFVVSLVVLVCFERTRFWQMLSMSLICFVITFIAIPHENELLASGLKQEHEKAIAKVGDEVISREQLEGPLAQRLYDLKQQMYRLKRERLDQMVAEMVLKKEAEQRGVTPQQLLNDEVLSKAGDVSDDEVERYMQANRNRVADWTGTAEDLKSRVRSFLRKQREYEKVMEYAKSLESKYPVTIYLREPSPPFESFKTEGNPTLGPVDAPVTVIEFSDYECPACRSAHEVVRKMRELYEGQVRWVFRDFPLKMHKDAEGAAEAAQCAAEQNKFWDYQDLLFGSREALSPEQLERYAEQLGLSSGQFKQCLESGKYKSKINKEIEEAQKIGIDRTPSFIINGKLMTGGPSLERFKGAIEAELKKTKEKQP